MHSLIKMKHFIKSRAISAQQILGLGMKEYPTLLQGIFPLKGIAAIGGSSDLGKSYFLQQLSVAVSSGNEEFVGIKLNVPKNAALYISTEDDDFTMNIRLQHLQKLANKEGLNNLRFIFDPQNLVETIDRELSILPSSLVIVDAFGDTFRGSLNDSISIRNFLDPFKELYRKHECLIVFNHHCGKHNQFKVPSKDNLLGSQGFESSMRTLIEMRQDPKDESKRHLCIVKGNNIGNANKATSIELIFDFENGFKPTGNRIPFDRLVVGKNGLIQADIGERVMQLKKEGKSIREISNLMKEDGVQIGKTKVAEMVNKQLKESIEENATSLLNPQ